MGDITQKWQQFVDSIKTPSTNDILDVATNVSTGGMFGVNENGGIRGGVQPQIIGAAADKVDLFGTKRAEEDLKKNQAAFQQQINEFEAKKKEEDQNAANTAASMRARSQRRYRQPNANAFTMSLSQIGSSGGKKAIGT